MGQPVTCQRGSWPGTNCNHRTDKAQLMVAVVVVAVVVVVVDIVDNIDSVV